MLPMRVAQLLVNKTLFEKTGATGFGVVQFLLDECEEQQVSSLCNTPAKLFRLIELFRLIGLFSSHQSWSMIYLNELSGSD